MNKKFKLLIVSLLSLSFVGCKSKDEAFVPVQEDIDAIANNLVLSLPPAGNITSNFTLPITSLLGESKKGVQVFVDIAWTSDNAVIAIGTTVTEGKITATVNRPAVTENNVSVKLTAVVSYEELSKSIDFTRTVAKKSEVEYKLIDIAELQTTAVKENDPVKLEGLVITGFMPGNGFYVNESATKGAYVYCLDACDPSLAVGDVVTVKGAKTNYFNLMEIQAKGEVSLEVTKTGTRAVPSSAGTYTPTQLLAEYGSSYVANVSPAFNKHANFITIKGKLKEVANGNSTDVIIEDTTDTTKKVVLYYKVEALSSANKAGFLSQWENKIVEIDVLTYGFHSSSLVWRVSFCGTVNSGIRLAS